ncbi:MAG: MFS transporter [Thermodesulfobacteriota bacterium]|nr:MFS transporter [Thermodesulfobacteriota bacterium]
MFRTRLPRNVIALGLVSLLTDFSSDMIYPLLPVFLTATLGAGPAALGVIEGVAEATASLLKLFSGAWSDRVGRKKPLVLAGYFLSSVARPLVGFASTWTHVLAVRFSDRIGKGIRTSPRDALIASSIPAEDRGRAYGLHRAMDHLGAVFGPVAAFLLLAGAGVSYRSVFFLAAVPGAAAMAALLFLVRDEGTQPPRKNGKIPLSRDLPPAFRRYLLIVSLFTLGNASDSFLILRAVDSGVPAAWVPLLWGAFHVVKSSFSTYAGILSDRWSRRHLIIGGWLVYAGTYMLWGMVEGAGWMVALFLVYGLYSAATEGTERAFVADFVPAGMRGTAFGWYHLAVGLAALPASVLFGMLWDAYGPRTAFGVSAGLAVSASVLLLLLSPPSAPSEDRPASR